MSPRNLLLALLTTVALAGCQWQPGSSFPTSPAYLGTPEPSLVKVTLSRGAVASVDQVRITVYALWFAGRKGLSLREAAIDYFDMNGAPIPGLAYPRQALPQPVEVPAPTQEQNTSVSFDLPVYRPEIGQYGLSNPATINGSVSLFGSDPDGHTIELRFNVPIQFIPSDPT